MGAPDRICTKFLSIGIILAFSSRAEKMFSCGHELRVNHGLTGVVFTSLDFIISLKTLVLDNETMMGAVGSKTYIVIHVN